MSQLNYDIMENSIAKNIIEKFTRKCPKNLTYLNRLVTEFNVIINKNFYEYILQVVELLDLVSDIPHIIRGSAGSSLVCYCLGITNIDPVADNVSFARFLNESRETMPDIDFDFPHNRRDEVFQRINTQLNFFLLTPRICFYSLYIFHITISLPLIFYITYNKKLNLYNVIFIFPLLNVSR